MWRGSGIRRIASIEDCRCFVPQLSHEVLGIASARKGGESSFAAARAKAAIGVRLQVSNGSWPRLLLTFRLLPLHAAVGAAFLYGATPWKLRACIFADSASRLASRHDP